ncbi:MAG: hypothetical protein ACREXP_15910 [Steroidobacteraceae bacterium]
MRLCIFDADRIGIIQAASVFDITELFADIARPSWPYPAPRLADSSFSVGAVAHRARAAAG